MSDESRGNEVINAILSRAREQQLSDIAMAIVRDLREDSPGGSPLVILSVDGSGTGRQLLSRVARFLAAKDSWHRSTGQSKGMAVFRRTALDLFRSGYGDEAGVMLVEEAPLVPHWVELTDAPGSRFVATASVEDWSALARAAPQEAPTGPIATVFSTASADALAREDQPVLAAYKADDTLSMLASLGLPMPASTLQRLAGLAQIEAASSRFLLSQELACPRPGVWSMPSTSDAFELLQTLLRRARQSDGPVLLALMRKLVLRGRSAAVGAAVSQSHKLVAQVWGPDPFARLAWAKLLMGVGSLDVAQDALAVSVGVEGITPAAGYYLEHQRAVLEARYGRYDEAIRALRRITQQWPRNAHTLQSLASVLRRAGRGGEALQVLELAEEAAPHNPHVLVESALIRTVPMESLPTREDYQRAEGALRLASRLAPGNGVVLNAWARLLRRQARFDEARRILHRAIGCEPWNVYHHVELAALLKADGRVEESVASARLAVDRAPGNTHALLTLADALLDLARLMQEEGRQTESLELLKESEMLLASARERGETVQLLTALGTLATQKGDWNGAERRFRRALRLQPGSPHVLTAWASSYLNRGSPHEAANALGLRDAPEGSDEETRTVYATLSARITAALGHPDRAVEELRHQMQSLPGHPGLYTTLIELQLLLGSAGIAGARSDCAFARERFPDNVYLRRACRRVAETG